jgi:tetratricopeptide (TPR) repeat protein
VSNEDTVQELLDKGLTCYGLGQIQEALDTWRRVLLIDPDNQRAMEYMQFVETSWAPDRQREGKPYRPDEGSDPDGGRILGSSIPPDSLPGESETAFGKPPMIQAKKEVDSTQEVAPDSKSRWRPVKPVVQASQWGDLYQFGSDLGPSRSPPAVPDDPGSPEAAAATQHESDRTAEQVRPEVSREAQSWPQDLDGDRAPGRESQISTLPPHPVANAGGQAGEQKPPTLDSASEAAVEHEPQTRSYESVPTRVRMSESKAGGESVAPGRDGWDMSHGISVPKFDDDYEPYEEIEEGDSQPRGLGVGALDLVAGAGSGTPPASGRGAQGVFQEVGALLKGAEDMLELDDFSGALELVDKILEQEPENPRALQMRSEARRELESIYSSKLGDLDRVPRVRMAGDEIIWLNLDHRAGFIMSLVDGQLSYDEILSVCGLDPLEAMRILVQLVQEKVIEVA